MGNKTGIEWTDATWNPIRGCSRVSKGCEHCYAERVAHRFSGAGQPYAGLTSIVNGHPAWNGQVKLVEEHLLDPLRWGGVTLNGEEELVAGAMRRVYGQRARRIFVNSMSDLFHESVPDGWIDRIFAVMALCPQHTFQVLTKRPERMLAWFDKKRPTCMSKLSADSTAWHVWGQVTSIQAILRRETCCPFMWDQQVDGADAILGWPPPNVQLGVSVEDQKTADERIPLLLQTPAAVRFISAEPLLGAIDLKNVERQNRPGKTFNAFLEHTLDGRDSPHLDWVIVGGESGPGARPMHPDWARGLRDQCVAAGVPLFFKQWGEYIPASHNGGEGDEPERVGKKAAGSLLDGREWKEFPGVKA